MSDQDRKRYRLRKLRITRCDTVVAGANEHARVLIYKAAPPMADTGGMRGMTPQQRRRMQELRRRLEAGEITQAAFDAEMTRMKRMSKSADEGGDTMPDDDQLTELARAIDEAVTQATGPLAEQIQTLTRERDEALAKAAPADGEDVLKGVPEAVRKRLEDAEAVAKAARERVERMEDEADTARWLDVAKGLDHVARAPEPGGNGVASLAGHLKAVAKADPAAAEALVKTLTAANTAIASSELLKATGSASAQLSDTRTELAQAAEAIRKANPTLTAVQAEVQALQANPDLARRVRDEEYAHA